MNSNMECRAFHIKGKIQYSKTGKAPVAGVF